MYYWAFGSNLCKRHMRVRCPAANPVGPMTVDDAALIFRGVADVTVRKESIVPGGLWRITRECEAALDRYEGVSSRLYLKRYLTIKVKGKIEDCLFYQMSTHRGVMPPSEGYLGTILEGYRDFDLDTDILNAAVEESWGTKKVTPFLKERHLRRGGRLARLEQVKKDGDDEDAA